MENTKTPNSMKKASMKYAQKNMKRIPFSVQKSSYEELKAEAENAGETVNGYIKKAIAMRIGRDFDSAKLNIMVRDVLSIDIKDLIKRTPLAQGNEKYVDVVISENGKVVSDTPLSAVKEEYYQRDVIKWTVEVDPQDLDSLIVRIYI